MPLAPGNRTATLPPPTEGVVVVGRSFFFLSIFVYSFIVVCFINPHHIKSAIWNKQTLLDNIVVFISAIKIAKTIELKFVDTKVRFFFFLC